MKTRRHFFEHADEIQQLFRLELLKGRRRLGGRVGRNFGIIRGQLDAVSFCENSLCFFFVFTVVRDESSDGVVQSFRVPDTAATFNFHDFWRSVGEGRMGDSHVSAAIVMMGDLNVVGELFCGQRPATEDLIVFLDAVVLFFAYLRQDVV